MQGCGLDRPDDAGAGAVRAALEVGFQQRRAQALARQLQQAEGGDAAELDARPVVLHRLLQAAFDRGVVAGLLHVDEIDHDEAREVAQAKLARHLVGGFEVGLVGRLLDVALARGAARVDVDGNQRLGRVDDDVAAGAELHDRAVDRVDLGFHLIAVEQRDRLVLVLHHALGVARHHHAHEVARDVEAGAAFHPDLVDVVGVEIADRALDEVRLLIDEAGGGGLQRLDADVVPQAQQILQIALDFRLGAFQPRGAQDDRHAFRNVQVGQDVLQALAVGGVGDLAGNPAAAPGVGHQHAVAARQRQVGGQGGALVAALLLGHLDQHHLPALDDFLDLVAAQRAGAAAVRLLDLVPADDVRALGLGGALRSLLRIGGLSGVAVRGEGRGVAFEALALGLGLGVGAGHGGELFHHLLRADRLGHHRAVGGGLGAGLGLLLQPALLGQQGLTVGDRDAVIVGMDFREGQEAVPVSAIFHEGRLERRLDPGHLGKVDVALELLPGRDFEVEIFESVSIDHGDPGFFRVRGVHQHALGHTRSP